MASIGTRLANFAVKTYQRHISTEYNGTRGSQCAYHSSCSGHARETLQTQGLSGLPRVLARLRRCTPENNGHRLGQLLRYTANCPESRLHEFFHFETTETRQAFLVFRKQVLEGAAQLSNSQDETALATLRSALNDLALTTHFRVDEPAGEPVETPGFHLSPRRVARATVMADRGPLGNALRGAASLTAAGLAGVIGGLGGAVVGLAVGGIEGLASGLGLKSSLEAWSDSNLGVGSLSGTGAMRQRVDRIYQQSRRILGFESLANIVGGATGLAIGLVSGLQGGLSLGSCLAWDMGRVLGRSASDAALEPFIAARGNLEVAAAKVPAVKPSAAESTVAQQAQAMWNTLTDTPEALSDRQRPATAPHWQFAVFSDATASELESAEIRRVVEFERNLPTGTTARINLRRGGIVPNRIQKFLPWAKLASAAVGMAAVAGVTGAALAPVLLARATSLGLSTSAVKELVRDSLTENEASWSGQRSYALKEALPGRVNQIQSVPVTEQSAVLPLSQSQLADELQAAFPQGGPRVAVFSGHGRSYQHIAGYDPKVLGGALAEVARRTQQKTDLVVLEACYTGTLEALRPLAAGARYALVSQLPVLKVGLPWRHILKSIDELGQNPKDLACGIVDLVGGKETVPSLSVIDLEQLERLAQELEKLARQLPPQMLAQALPAGDLSRPDSWGQRLQDRLKGWLPGSQSGDLASILDKLQSQTQDPELLAQISSVRGRLESAVVSSRSDGLGGLSVETRSPLFDQSGYEAATGLESWAAGLAAAQPTALKPLGRLAHRAEQQLELTTNAWLEWQHGAVR